MPLPDERPPRRPLRRVPAEIVDRLDAAGRRELADLGADLDRRFRERARIGLPGGAPCPPFLQGAEDAAPGAARLYVCLDGERFDAARAVEVGAALQLDREGALAALDELQRAELVRGPADALATVPPGGVPF